jgi:hypothetical protein
MSGAADTSVAEMELACHCALLGASRDTKLMSERMVNAMPHTHALCMRIAATLLLQIAFEIDMTCETFQGVPPVVSRTVQ